VIAAVNGTAVGAGMDMAVVRSTRDSAEAMAAFRERRAPRFEGR
jgi:hypothetical protein